MHGRTLAIVVGMLGGAWACAGGPRAEEPPWPAPVGGGELGARVGQRVVVVGREAREIWQHLVGGVPGKQALYFDLADGEQIVVHLAAPFACAGDVTLAGTVLEVRGPSKRPGREGETKVDDSYVEYALDVDAWRCPAGR